MKIHKTSKNEEVIPSSSSHSSPSGSGRSGSPMKLVPAYGESSTTISWRRSHMNNSGRQDICWPPPPLGINAAQRAILGSRGNGSATTTPWYWKRGNRSKKNDTTIEPYPNCFTPSRLHFVRCLLIFVVTAVAH